MVKSGESFQLNRLFRAPGVTRAFHYCSQCNITWLQ